MPCSLYWHISGDTYAHKRLKCHPIGFPVNILAVFNDSYKGSIKRQYFVLNGGMVVATIALATVEASEIVSQKVALVIIEIFACLLILCVLIPVTYEGNCKTGTLTWIRQKGDEADSIE